MSDPAGLIADGGAPTSRERSRIFIAYETHDFEFVHELTSRLEDAQPDTFMAIATLLTAGQKWQEGLSRALRDTDAVLVIVSEASIGIPDLLAESGAALAMFQEQGRPLVIPIIIDRIEVPAPLAARGSNRSVTVAAL